MADTARQVDHLDGAPVVLALDAGQWESWLADHHDEPAGAWLMIAKKNTGVTTVTQPEALDGALCFGWIDSVRRSMDAHLLPAAVLPASAGQRVVGDQCRASRGAGCRRAHARARPGRGRASKGGRPVPQRVAGAELRTSDPVVKLT